MKSQNQFVVSHQEQKLGPFSKEEIVERLHKGEFSVIDFVYVEEKKDWVTLLEFVPEARPKPKASSTPPPPPKPGPPQRIQVAEAAKASPPLPPPGATAKPSSPPQLLKEIANGQKPSFPPTSTPSPELISKSSSEAAQKPSTPPQFLNSKNSVELSASSAPSSKPTAPPKSLQGASSEGPTKISAPVSGSVPPAEVIANSTSPTLANTNEQRSQNEPPAQAVSEKDTHQRPVPPATPAVNEVKEPLHLKDGVGTIDLLQFKAGRIKVRIKGLNDLNLEAPEVIPLTIKAAQAVEVSVKGPEKFTAGESANFQLEALDSFGNRDVNFDGQITVQVTGSARGAGPVSFSKGQADFTITNEVAETFQLKLVNDKKHALKFNDNFTVTVFPGAPARYVLESPNETVAGQAVQLVVKVVDAFGNHVKDFDGDVKIEVDEDSEFKVASGS